MEVNPYCQTPFSNDAICFVANSVLSEVNVFWVKSFRNSLNDKHLNQSNFWQICVKFRQLEHQLSYKIIVFFVFIGSSVVI